MYVQPNSTIILYSGMPLDESYSDTLYFDSLSAQTSFFQSNYVKHRLTQNTYQRVNSGVFEANLLADLCYDCNYMAFQNTNFGNKWFYAFITSVEYVNNGNARINYVIDVLQTYFFDAELEYCFVEREHDSQDLVFSNLLPEPVALGEYVYGSRTQICGDDFYEMDTIIEYVDVDQQGNVQSADGYIVNGIFSGCKMMAFYTGVRGSIPQGLSAYALNHFIEQNIQKPDAIVNMYCCPHWVSGAVVTGVSYDGQTLTPSAKDTNRFIGTTFNTGDLIVDGYTIQNRKLMSYPYRYLMIDNGCGASLPLRFEFFNQTNMYVDIYGTMTSPVQMTLTPKNYKNVDGLLSESITIDGYPLCSWNYDTYKAFVAQNTVPVILDAAGALFDAGANVASGNVAGAVGGIVHTGLNIAKQFYTASIQADTVRGNFYNGGVMMSTGNAKFYKMTVRQPVEIIKSVDNFFSMYGYTTNRVKIPNRNVRPHWTYTKTDGCKVKGACPSDALKRICSIYDAGITFWKNASEVGNYSLDNRPI